MVQLTTYYPVHLSRMVKSFWCLQVATPDGNAYTENIFPDGHHEMIFSLEENSTKRSFDGTHWINEPTAFFAGQTLKSYALEMKSGSLLYGIRFHPHTLQKIFNFPAHELTNRILPAHEIRKAALLKHCISENPEETFRNFEKVLSHLCSSMDLPANKFQYVEYAISEMVHHKGNIRIDQLIDRLDISHRYFDTLFTQSVGINPKPFCNIIRLNHLISFRNNNPSKSLTECCYEANFFDQSHFIKLFRSTTDQSPKEYFNVSNQISNIFAEL